MQLREMDLRQYCGLNRPRFAVDPEADAEFFFGNLQVQKQLFSRVQRDFNVRGAPKCGVVGRFGAGKTHTLYHLKYVFNTRPDFGGHGVYVRIGPYDEGIPGMGGWKYLQTLILDAIGEGTIREWVRAFDTKPGDRTGSLGEGLGKVFQFGDENLKQSLANVLADYFLRDGRPTLHVWNWLKGGKAEKVESSVVTKTLDTGPELVNVLLNLANLCRDVTGKALVLLLDEAQHLGDVKKREHEIHDAFLQMAEPANQNLGFIIGYFGSGQEGLPRVLSTPPDVLSRLGVSTSNLQEAFVDLARLINSEDALLDFMSRILQGIRDGAASDELVKQFNLSGITPSTVPFTEDALDRLAEVLWQREPTRNARTIIETLAVLAADAYELAKAKDKYELVDRSFVDASPYIGSL